MAKTRPPRKTSSKLKQGTVRYALVNLALFPITALLLLLSGVGAPAHPGDNRNAAKALIKAILGNAGDGSAPRQRITLTQDQSVRRYPARTWTATSQIGLKQVRASSGPCLRSHGNRKAYRARFGFVEGAYQPQGPPQILSRA